MIVAITHISAESDSDEIRFCLRSWETNYPTAEILIVGDKPNWYKGKHLDIKRLPYKDPERNYLDSQNKLKAVAQTCKEFVWVMDDVFLCQPITDAFFQDCYFSTVAIRTNAASTYDRIKKRTLDVVKSKLNRCVNYGTHMPFHFYSDKLLALEALYGWARKPALLTDCLYYNVYYDDYNQIEISPAIQYRHKANMNQLRFIEAMKNKPIIVNCTAGAFNIIRGQIRNLFPNPSRYEA